jgi:hypothetical protein
MIRLNKTYQLTFSLLKLIFFKLSAIIFLAYFGSIFTNLDNLNEPLRGGFVTIVLTLIFCLPFSLPLFFLLLKRSPLWSKILVISVAVIPDILFFAFIPLAYCASNKAHLIPSSLYYIYMPIIVLVEVPFIFNLKSFFKKKASIH